jgi:hypothetical protein
MKPTDAIAAMEPVPSMGPEGRDGNVNPSGTASDEFLRAMPTKWR